MQVGSTFYPSTASVHDEKMGCRMHHCIFALLKHGFSALFNLGARSSYHKCVRHATQNIAPIHDEKKGIQNASLHCCFANTRLTAHDSTWTPELYSMAPWQTRRRAFAIGLIWSCAGWELAWTLTCRIHPSTRSQINGHLYNIKPTPIKHRPTINSKTILTSSAKQQNRNSTKHQHPNRAACF